MDNDSYLLLLLSDGNLPTGSFVSSSGLESYFKHGFPLLDSSTSKVPKGIQPTIEFIKSSLSAYAHLALPFVTVAHATVEEIDGREDRSVLEGIKRLDKQYESMTLNHITRRASKAQGVALLTLFSKGFNRPSWVDTLGAEYTSTSNTDTSLDSNEETRTQMNEDNVLKMKTKRLEGLVDAFKLIIRKGETPGHLPICWGVLTGCLGLSQERSQQLFLFLYARSLLSAAIRLNTIGPYAAQQLLLHVIHQMVDNVALECSSLKVPSYPRQATRVSKEADIGEEDFARWEREGISATTWPLGEILQGRHDLQHSRIFNS